MNDLKPCPFCGALPQCGATFYESCGKEIKLVATVECAECGTSKRVVFKASDNVRLIPFWDYEKAFDKVVDQWNHRVPIHDEYEVYG